MTARHPHTATLAVAPNGNWSLTCTHPKFPPIAIPGNQPVLEVFAYARNLLFCGKVVTAAQTERICFDPCGHTVDDKGTHWTAYRADIPTT